MRYDSCQKYLDLYTKNPEVCSLLIALDCEGLVLGRALLWVSTEGRKLMDTIYSHESLFQAFKGWAMDNDYYYKSSQSCHHESYDMFNGSTHDKSNIVSVRLKHDEYDYYPYLDTMKYLDGYILNNEEGDMKLTNTDGTYEGNDGVYSEWSDEYIDEEDAIHLEYTRPNGRRINSYVRYCDCVSDANGEYYLEEDCVEVSGDWYLRNDDNVVEDINGDWQLADNCVHSEAEGGYILSEDARLINGGDDYCLQDHAVKCEFDGEWYHEDDMVCIEGQDIYKENQEDYLLTLNEAE